MRYLLLLIIFVFSFSCQTRNYRREQLNVVEIGDTSSKPKVTDKDSKENVYGPTSDSLSHGDNNLEPIEKNPIIAIDLAPALYNSFSYIELLDQMDRLGVKPKIIITSGFSSIIAALYAKYESANRVNFKMFSLLNQIKNKEAFSADWMSIVSEFIEEEFEDDRQERFKTIVILPAYNGRNIRLIKSGSVSQNLMNALNLNRPYILLLGVWC